MDEDRQARGGPPSRGGYARRVALRLYDTATRQVRDFVPLQAGKVGIYLCGLTVQSEPHVGHVRSGVGPVRDLGPAP